MARVVVAALVLLFGGVLLFASLVDAAGYGAGADTLVRCLAAVLLMVLAWQVVESRWWAAPVLAAILLIGAGWSFATRHQTRFPEEPDGGRAALLVVMSLALLVRDKTTDNALHAAEQADAADEVRVG